MLKSKHYAFVPEETLLSDKFKKLKPHAKLLYAFLTCKRGGKDEWFTYSYKEIRKDTGFKFNTIASCIRQLERHGFIDCRHGGLEVNNNNYYLEPSWLEL